MVSERIHERGNFKDVYDGKMYRTFVHQLPPEDRKSYVTSILNSDGAPVWDSSNFSIVPVYLMLNELPIHLRLKNIIATGLWFGKSRPAMSVILTVFVQCINEYSTRGIQCTIKNETRHIKLYVLETCVDTIARPTMNGTVQFNGHFGCDWCEHPGKSSGGNMK